MTDDGSRRTWLRGCAQPLATRYDVALLDLDGVVYLGPQPIAGAATALAKVREVGMRLAFVTNNASRDPATVAAHLSRMGVPATADEVVTSAQAAASVVLDRLGPGASVLVVGSPALRDIVRAAGLRPVLSAEDRPAAVVQGFWAQLCYEDLAAATLAVRGGSLWVATNVDATLPSPRGLLPGNGSLVGVVATASGQKPIVAGKPELPLHAEGVRRMKANRPLVVGDRLDTDIEGANAAATDSLLVMTGVTTVTELLNAPAEHRPTYLACDLRGLLEPHPEVVVDATGARCGDWLARRRDGARAEVELIGDGPAFDGLRAVLALSWSADDAGEELLDAARALDRLDVG
ncbi:MAG TPA: HAD-IIA family hydrolase [Acidothermaceae bacterium]